MITCHGLYGSLLDMSYFRPNNLFIMSDDDNEFMGVNQKPKKSPEKPSQPTNIKVVVKLRPLLASQSTQQECVTVKDDGQTVQISDPPNITRETIDRAFSKQSTQKQLYDYIAPTIEKITQGFNVSMLSYGQTGSGKTYTMFGSDWDTLIKQDSESKTGKKQTTFFGNIESDENFAGMIPRAMHHIFSKLYSGKKNVTIYCSFLQLYNEKLIDLLEIADKQLIIHESKTDGIYVEGLSQTKVNNFEECVNLMKRGQRNRTVRQTHMNTKSSRSHSIFQFLIEEVFPNRTYRRTKLNLCDLAGSEKINKMEEMEIIHFKELKNINLSLTTLGKVIWSLSSKDQSVPCYRQSKLTRLLQDSLGGNTYTTIFGNITSKVSSLEQTINTLKFIQRAKQVRTQVFVKSYKDQPQLQEMQKEISYLKSVLKMKRLPSEHKQLAEKVKELEMENRRLRKLADEQSHARLMDQNNQMKIQLEKLQIDRMFIHSPAGTLGTLGTLEHRSSEQADHRKLMTSQTIDKHSTNTQLPQLQSRYSNHSSHREVEQRHINLNSNQNIILRRLDLIEKMKAENKERLERKLRELERGNRTVNSVHQRSDFTYKPNELAISRHSKLMHYANK